MDLKPSCYTQCAAMILQGRQPYCQDCKECSDAIVNGTQIAWRQLRQRVSRAAEGTRVRRATREESQRDKEERMNKIAAANEDNDLRESLCLTYSRKCPVCLRKHPEKRVSYLCGHIVCEPCAESQEMQNGKICPFCKSARSYHRLFEEDGEEVEKIMWIIQFFLLAAALVCTSTAAELFVTEYKLPEAFVDGTIITFYFWHSGDHWDRPDLYSKTQYAYINFYDVASVDNDTVYDIPAQLRLETDYFNPVTSNTFQDGRWHKEENKFQFMDGLDMSGEWWRVDIYKHDSYRMNVFFKGFWSGVRTFHMPLDNIKSINIVSEYVDPKWVESYKFVNFTIGSRIDMIAFLRSNIDPTQLSSLAFSQDGTVNSLFFIITQQWPPGQWATQQLTLEDSPDPVICSDHNGDLQHLRIERTAYDTIKVTLSVRGVRHVDRLNETCEIVLSNMYFYHHPFTIMSKFGGAMMFHLEHTMARFEGK
ncbi:hypothetical protein PRIPAC_90452 [Pristionchus pacificus]|uniref:RING-type domain-containing protein n=1 Tax=Pristionchus pacificus TaxID=54126 RepID=A0A2A6CTG6_PRIPA|nr:hypothetical protein PRIPAC_90452 [Pristionchus pacificus]|eukprot:PDM81522.1 hypothetical protein PRIPAC_35398 [Pristionchus pacificus]